MSDMSLFRNERGASALEFAFAAPVLFIFVIAIAQLGTVFFANTGLQHALSEGTRMAAVYPVPSDAAITAAVTNRRLGYDPAHLDSTVQLITKGQDGTKPYIDLRLRYRVPLNLLLRNETLTLEHSRRVYTQELPPPPPATPATPATPAA